MVKTKKRKGKQKKKKLLTFSYREPVVEGDPGCATTLDHIIHMYGVVEDRTIREVMDIHGDLLCYDYVDPEP